MLERRNGYANGSKKWLPKSFTALPVWAEPYLPLTTSSLSRKMLRICMAMANSSQNAIEHRNSFFNLLFLADRKGVIGL